jgi:hypothetical protein
VVEAELKMLLELHKEILVEMVVPVSFSLHILHKYTQGYIPINNKNIYSL